MGIHKKIRFMRQQKGWSQEEMANHLGMSLNGYGGIERGDTDIGLSRLKQIAELFGMSLGQLVNLNEKGSYSTFNFFGTNSTGVNEGTQTNNNYCNCYFACNAPECDYLRQQIELERLRIINEYEKKELVYLKEINELKEKELNHLRWVKEINNQSNVTKDDPCR